jgi:hypothetical protein
MARTGLEEFKEVMSDFRSVTFYTVNGVVIAPLADLALKIGPPWPAGIPVITSLAELLALIFVFHYWFKRRNQKRLRKRMTIALCFASLSFILYMFLFSLFTFSPPSTRNKAVKGFVVRTDIKPLIDNSFTESDALKGAEYDATEVWTEWSITTMKCILLVVWLTLFTGLSVFIGTFIMAQRMKLVKISNSI